MRKKTPTKDFTPVVSMDEAPMIIGKMPYSLMVFVPDFAREVMEDIKVNHSGWNNQYLLMCALFQAGRIQGIREERAKRRGERW